ncbi:Formin-like protein 13 [Euphorbia peplus]|nr:Formin-like protein 13 [Euphorbia peplus]
MALFRKLFYKKPPDGLLEICERVYVFDYCFTNDAWQEQNYKTYMGGVIGQLKEHFPDASFLGFNFHEEKTQSQLADLLSEYDMTIMEYPWQYEGCPLLKMEVIHHFLKSGESWLSLGQSNLLLMHCERAGWPVLAFMLAALLLYRKQYSGEYKTLDMIYRQAPRDLLQLLSPVNPIPSQLRYLQYVSRRNVASEWPPLDRGLTLDCVIIRFIPDFDGQGGCRPVFRIYGHGVSQPASNLSCLSPRRKPVRTYKQAESELIKVDISCHVQGDVVLECITFNDDMEHEKKMFRAAFNTAFIRSNILILNRDEIDIPWDAKNQFPKEFRAEILFSEMDAADSFVKVDFNDYEAKEGLPVEAFAKVHEIFSSVDWCDSNADLALNMLQQMNVSNAVQGKSDSNLQQTTHFVPQSPRREENKKVSGFDAGPAPVLEKCPGQKWRSTAGIKSSVLSAEKFDLMNALKSSSDASVKSSLQSPSQSDPISKPPSHADDLESKAATNQTIAASPGTDSLEQPLMKSSTSVTLPPSSAPIDQPSVSKLVNASFTKEIQNSPKTASDTTSTLPPTPPISLLVPPLRDNQTVKSVPPTPSRTPSPPLRENGKTNGLLQPPPPPTLPLNESSKTCFGPPPPPPPPPPLPPSTFISAPSSPTQAPPPSTFLSAPSSPTHPPPPSTSSSPTSSAPPPSTFISAPSSPTHPPPPPTSSSTPSAPPPPPPPSDSSSAPSAPPAPSPPSTSSSAPPPPLPSTSSSAPYAPPPPPPSSTFSSAPYAPPPPPPSSTFSSALYAPPPRPPSSTFSSGPPPPPPPPSVSSSAPSAPPPPPPPSTSSSSLSAPPPLPPPSTSSSAPSAPPPPMPLGKSQISAPAPPSPSLPSISSGAKGRLPRNLGTRNQQTKKLKPLHWLKLTRAVQGSLWAETQKSGETSKAAEIDISELENLFSAAASNLDHGRKMSTQSSRAPKVEKVQLIDHRRAYNCEIMLSKVKVPLNELTKFVLALEDSVLDIDQVENLIKFCPTKEEIELLKNYTGEKEKLGRCEQFFMELMQVPRIESKLRVFSFKMQFLIQISDLRRSLNVVNSATEEIRSSEKLKRIMQTILSLGNALNQGTARGSAIGFRLDSLLKLTDTRARNSKITLMHYLCKVLADKLPELLDFSKELANLEPAARIQLKVMAEEMQAISKGLEKTVQELSTSESDGPISENFCKILKEFLRFAEAEVRSLASLYSGVGRNVDALILYFGEDPARCPFEQVVSTLVNFVRVFNKSHDENCKQLEIEMKKAAENEKPKISKKEVQSLGVAASSN